MSDAIDTLADRWKRNPDADTTIEICNALHGSVRTTLVTQVGSVALQKHGTNVPVLLAVARMYLMTQRLADAQSVLVAAGKISPKEGSIYRILGEVLLRRGDAERAEKVLERALQFGVDNDDARMWLERARVYKSMQSKAGTRAVAAEVGRTLPLAVPENRPASAPAPRERTPAPMRKQLDWMDEAETAIRNHPSVAPPAMPPIPPMPHPPPMPTGPTDVLAGPAEARIVPKERRFSPTAPTDGNDFDPMDISITGQLDEQAKDGLAKLPPPKLPPLEANGPVALERAPSPDVPEREIPKDQVPHPRDVLDALALAGIFEPPTTAAGALVWDRPEKTRRRGMIPLIVLTVLFIGGSVGGFFYVKHKRDIAHGQAETILAQVDKDLQAGRVTELVSIEDRFGKVFDLDSRSDHAALSWLRERAMSGLLKGGSEIAFQDALDRAKEVGVKEDKTAFAQVAAFLFQGDTVGAAALLSKWDNASGGDPYYQLFAGATLERAGDQRARDRYEASARLDPDLVPAQIALVRSMAIDGNSTKAQELAKNFRTKYADRIEGQALVALAWARDPTRTEQPPPEVQETIAKGDALPIGLRFVPHALSAVMSVDKHDFKGAKEQIEKGLAVVDSPGVATWLGLIAIDTGDEALARKAALAAVAFSAVYPPARVLAARVALLGARLDEAVKATEELDPSSPDVAVVRAAVAYERVDGVGLGAALDATSTEARKLPFLASLNLAQDVLAGHAEFQGDGILSLSSEDSPWSDLVAMDLALDAGDLDTAHKIAESWKGSEGMLRSLRLARLARYDGRLDDADKLSLAVIQGSTVTTRALKERVLVLVAMNKADQAAPLLARYPLVLGPLAGWLAAYAKASEGKIDDARGKTTQLDLPPPQAPLPARTLVAVALGAMKDRRRGADFVRDLYAQGVLDPDVVKAGEALGVPKPAPRKPARRK
jgi:tetratricopeptide (TPR) repeat protein